MDPRTAVARRFAAVERELRALSRWLFDNPEISFEEHLASERLAALMKREGFDVHHPAYGLATAFEAHAGSTGPRVVICAEYDALPGVGHACGHNIIAASALGAGLALEAVAERLGIRVTVLGTPAEEKFGGKVDLIEAGAFGDCAAAMMVHPSTRDVVDPSCVAIAELDVTYRGKTAHASAHPQVGINALDAFVQAYVNISTLRQQLYPSDKVHGIITSGGDAPNIIPDRTESSWYVRAETDQRLDELIERIHGCFEAAAIATGCTVEIVQAGHRYVNLISNELMADLFAQNSERLGRRMHRGGDLSEAGSTDMGNVSHVVPAIHPMLDIGAHPAVNHQAEFAAHTVTSDGERAIRDGALAMAYTVIDLAERNLWGQL